MRSFVFKFRIYYALFIRQIILIEVSVIVFFYHIIADYGAVQFGAVSAEHQEFGFTLHISFLEPPAQFGIGDFYRSHNFQQQFPFQHCLAVVFFQEYHLLTVGGILQEGAVFSNIELSVGLEKFILH